MDATVPQPPMGFRGGLLKAAVVVPDLIISTLIGFVLLAACPPGVAVGFLAGLLLMSLGLRSAALRAWSSASSMPPTGPPHSKHGTSRGRCAWSSTGADVVTFGSSSVGEVSP